MAKAAREAERVRNFDERPEFWKPVVASHSETEVQSEEHPHCLRCGSGLSSNLAGTSFCDNCAGAPASATQYSLRRLRSGFGFVFLRNVRDILGQNSASMSALVLGSACLIAAFLTGLIFTASTLLDWQAVQIWRVEWLLAAIAFFTAGNLLKKK